MSAAGGEPSSVELVESVVELDGGVVVASEVVSVTVVVVVDEPPQPAIGKHRERRRAGQMATAGFMGQT